MSSKAALKGKKGKKQDEEKEREWMNYLKKHHFIDKFKDAVKEILDKEPNITKDPVKFIKYNIDYTNQEAREVERDLKITQKAIQKFEEENAILKYQLELYEASIDGTGSWSTTSRTDGEKPKHNQPDSNSLKKKK